MATDKSVEANLEEVVADRVSDLRWTKTAYFEMGKWVNRFSTGMNLLVLATTGGLTTVLYKGWLSTRGQLLLAAVASFVSLVTVVWSFDTKAYKYKKIGEMYNAMLKEFEEFYQITLLNDNIPTEKKKDKLNELTERHRNLNQTTPPTYDWVYRQISESDLGGTKDFDQVRQNS